MDNISIAEILQERYAITTCKITPDTRGSGTNYWIDDNYFLKMFSESVKYRVEDEIAVCRFLRSRGFPTSEHVPARDGNYIQQTGAYRYHLQRIIPGVSHSRNSLDYEACILLIRRLQQIVEILSGFPYKTEVNMLFSHEYVKSDILDSISMRRRNSAPDLVSVLERKIRLIKSIRLQNGRIQNAVLSHSDFNVQQILTADTTFKTLEDIKVIDFSHVSRVPIEWEIIKACLRSMCNEKESCVQAILNSLSLFDTVVPIAYENICIAVMQLISSSYMEKMYLNTHQQVWLDRIVFDLDVLEQIYESVR